MPPMETRFLTVKMRGMRGVWDWRILVFCGEKEESVAWRRVRWDGQERGWGPEKLKWGAENSHMRRRPAQRSIVLLTVSVVRLMSRGFSCWVCDGLVERKWEMVCGGGNLKQGPEHIHM